MDGILGDTFRNGRKLYPATEEYAVANFPTLILRLKQRKLLVTVQQFAGGPDVVTLRNPRVRYESWVIVKPDFDACKSIASKVGLRLFATDTDDTILSRIRALVQTEFAGRGVP